MGAAWRLKEAFADISDSAGRADAGRRFDDWMRRVEGARAPASSRPQPGSSTRERVLNYFDDRWTNAEGITNKIGVMKRRGYGHRRADRYRHRAQHLPVPARAPSIAQDPESVPVPRYVDRHGGIEVT